MTNDDARSYEEREARLDEILDRLDRAEVSMDDLAAEAREAAELIASMYETIRGTREEIASILDDLDTRDTESDSRA